jgi:sialic acid synthase SpsE
MTEIVAEISGNHAGSLGNALALIVSAAKTGADAVKFQCFMPERIAARRASNKQVLALAEAHGMPLIDIYRKVWTPWEWFPMLIETAKDNGLAWFSSVFDPADVTFLEHFHCPRYKISAFEMLDWDIIKAVRETGKPIVLSVRPTPDVTVLHATNYDGSLRPLGLSDHGAADIPANAPMIEWHLKLPGIETVDGDFSLTPDEMRRKIKQVRELTGQN